MMRPKTLDWYENELERSDISDDQIAEYEAAIDKLLTIERMSQDRLKLRKIEEQKRIDEIRAQLESGDTSVIDVVGIPEFGGDYDISLEDSKHIVYSKVARDDQESRHIHSSLKDAVQRYRKLIWDRLYTKYVRSGEFDSLKKMS